MRTFSSVLILLGATWGANAGECPLAAHAGEPTLLYIEGVSGKSSHYSFRRCVLHEGDRREVRTLTPSGGYRDLSVSQGRSTIDTTYDRPDEREVREYTKDILDLDRMRPGDMQTIGVRTFRKTSTHDWSYTTRALAERQARLGSCVTPVVDLEHVIQTAGWTQTVRASFAPSVGYVVELEQGPLTRGARIEDAYRDRWRVVRIGDRAEARRLCDDRTS